MPHKSSRHKPPSRVRYEQTHPTISVRIDRNTYNRLMEIRMHEGKSLGDILRAAIDMQEATADLAYERGLIDGRHEGYKQGFAKGEAAVRRKYLVWFRCHCGGVIEVTSGNVREAARQYLEQHGWGHSKCVQQTTTIVTFPDTER